MDTGSPFFPPPPQGAGGVEDRVAKPNLGSGEEATRRRAERSTRLVRQEHKKRLQEARQQQEESFPQLLIQYNRDALLAQGDLHQLELLCKLLRIGTEHEIEQHLDALISPQLVEKLTQTVVDCAEQPRPERAPYLSFALGCITNLTGTRTRNDVQCASLIIGKRFLQAAAFLLQLPPAQRNEDLVRDLWNAVGNLAWICKEARDAVLLSPIPLAAELGRMLASGQEQTHVLRVACVCMESGAPDLPNVPQGLLALLWQLLSRLLMRAFPAPRTEMEQLPPEWLSCLVCALEALASRAERGNRELLGSFLLSPVGGEEGGGNTADLIPYLMGAVMRVGTRLRIALARTLVALGHVAGAHERMVRAGGIPTMRRLVMDANERVRREGILWLSNLATESSSYVAQLLQEAAFTEIQRELQQPTVGALVDLCLRALIMATRRCIADRDENTLLGMLRGLQVVRLCAKYVDRPEHSVATAEILQLWRALLADWSREQTKELLLECNAHHAVNKLCGHNEGRIFRPACDIQQLISL